MTGDLKVYIKKLTKATAAKERMEEELKIAHKIQMGVLPKKFPAFPDMDEFDIYATLKSAREVGGDFYDFFFISSTQLCFIIGDVSGKGVPASLFMTAVLTLIRAIARDSKSPHEILERVNNEIARENNSSMFVTIFCGILEVSTGDVLYASGGHNPPLLIAKGKGPEFLTSSSGTVIGAFQNLIFTSEKITLSPGDAIFLYTDGVTEAFNKERDLFSEERLIENLSTHYNTPIQELVSKIFQDIKDFAPGVPQSDDITIMALRFFKKT